MKTKQPNPKKEKRFVQVLHKLSEEGLKFIRMIQKDRGPVTDKEARSALAIGRVFRFERSKTAYVVTSTGAVRRVEPKPWHNKAERKKFLKERRREREGE